MAKRSFFSALSGSSTLAAHPLHPLHPLQRSGALPADVESVQANRTLIEHTYATLRTDIIEGRLSPGSKLRIEHLRTQYAVGAGTLREALTTKEKGPKVLIAQSECMLNRQRREKPLVRKAIASSSSMPLPGSTHSGPGKP